MLIVLKVPISNGTVIITTAERQILKLRLLYHQSLPRATELTWKYPKYNLKPTSRKKQLRDTTV